MPSPERLFLAVPLSEPARESLHAQLPAELPGRRVPPANWHFTLRFLGDTAPEMRDRLVATLQSAPLGAPSELRFGKLGAFPRPERARVLWVGVDEEAAGRLAGIAAKVEDRARGVGFEAERKRFAAHLTVARLEPPRSVAPLVAATAPLDIVMPVEAVVLFRSHLGHGPPRYEMLARFALGAPG